MKRHNILRLIQSYKSFNEDENRMLDEAMRFIQDNPDCFERSLLKGHVTGSSWIVNPERTHVLLLHHAKLDKWVQPGGHCDGNSDVISVAAKEAQEETGLIVKPVSDQIFDIDNHIIPERNDVPEHTHYDIRFLFEAETNDNLIVNHESKSVQWVRLDDVHLYNSSPSLMRMVHKTQ